MKELVSVIIPVFNNEKHLVDCVNSVLEQSYVELEIILVDDGSTDGSGQICDEFARSYSNIKVFHNTNKGVSFSRNFGIEKSIGKYLLFVDSDDYVDPRFVEKLIDPFPQSDINFCRFSIDLGDSKKQYIETNLKKLVESPHDFSPFIIDENYINDSNIVTDCVFGSVCRCAFKRDNIIKNHVYFNEGVVLGEDLIFLCNYLVNVKKATLIDEHLYYYRKNQNSAVSKNATGYVRDFKKINYPLLKEKKAIIYNSCNNPALIDYLNMKFTLSFAVNELKLKEQKNIKNLKSFFKEHKDITFKISNLTKLCKFSFKRMVLVFLLKYRLWKCIRFFLR